MKASECIFGRMVNTHDLSPLPSKVMIDSSPISNGTVRVAWNVRDESGNIRIATRLVNIDCLSVDK